MSQAPQDLIFEELLRSLNGALRVAQLYPRGHQSIVMGLQKADEALRTLLSRVPAVHLGVLGEEIVYDKGDSYQASSGAPFLLKVLQDHGVDRVTFHKGCSLSDLSELLDVLQQSPEVVSEAGGAHRVLQTRGIRTITLERLTPTPLEAKRPGPIVVSTPALSAAAAGLVVQARNTLAEVAESVEGGRPIPTDPARSYAYELTKALVDAEASPLSLALFEQHEDAWLTRLVRVTAVAVAYGRRLGLLPEQMQALGTASFLYDVGLLALGLNRASVREDEPAYRRHPIEGARILLQSKNIDRLSVVVAFEHHMHHDLSGFPKVPGKKSVHPVAELVGLADAFVDLVSGAPDRRGLRSDEAVMRLSQSAGKAYETGLFSAFVATVGVFAPGTFVDLSDGRSGMVLSTNPLHVLRPVVRIISDETGRILPRPVDVDLSKAGPLRIIRSFDASERGIDPRRFTSALMGG